MILPVTPTLNKEERPGAIEEDTLHGMFAVTAKVGDAYSAIATWIGKHPKNKILLVLDEGTDAYQHSRCCTQSKLSSRKIPISYYWKLQINSRYAWTAINPKNGWDSISPDFDEWPTTQANGICQYFNPYRCPAILHPDPEMRKSYLNSLSVEIIFTRKKLN